VKVILVDDDERFLDALEALLATLSYVEVAGRAVDGASGADLAARLGPDIVVMDLDMPSLNGLEATRRIRREVPTAHVVILSGSDVIAHSLEALDAGAAAYVRKSRTVDDLPRVLDELRRDPTA
jgi:DNA-binding NarL/FixJ family response regulator